MNDKQENTITIASIITITILILIIVFALSSCKGNESIECKTCTVITRYDSPDFRYNAPDSTFNDCNDIGNDQNITNTTWSYNGIQYQGTKTETRRCE